MKVKITEIEFYLPKTIETLELLKNSNLEWNINLIEEKTGINKRFVTKNNETALDLGVKAANKISKEKLLQIDNLIYVTQSPEYALPTTACIIQQKLNLNNNVSCFDINQGCAGFVYALAVGGSMISNRISKKTLIICSDTYSKYIPKNDRTNRPIFSDGASAILIEMNDKESLKKFSFQTFGDGYKDLIVENSGSNFNNKKGKPKLFMNGNKVLMFTMSKLPDFILKFLKDNNLNINNIDKFIFHQASKIILENLRRKLNIHKNKIPLNYDKYGNTVSSSIPILMKDLLDQNKIKKNENLLLIGFGVGLSLGIALVRWP